MTNKDLLKKTVSTVLDIHTSLFRREDSYVPDAIQEVLDERDLTLLPETEDVTINIVNILTELATRFETTDEVLDEIALAADIATISAIAPIISDLVDWGKVFIGSHPTGIGGGDDE